jgi:hypothetical protein
MPPEPATIWQNKQLTVGGVSVAMMTGYTIRANGDEIDEAASRHSE